MEIEMTSRALSGQKDCVGAFISSFSWALAVRIELTPKPTAATALLAVINALRFILGTHHIVELRHKCALIWSHVVPQWFCSLHQHFLCACSHNFDRFRDEFREGHGTRLVIAVQKVCLHPGWCNLQNLDRAALELVPQ